MRARFCEIDGRVRGGMRVKVRAHFCKIDGRVPGGSLGCWHRCCFGMLFGGLFEAPLMVRAHFCKIDGRVLWECCLGVLFGVMVRARFYGSWCGAVRGAAVQSLARVR